MEGESFEPHPCQNKALYIIKSALPQNLPPPPQLSKQGTPSLAKSLGTLALTSQKTTMKPYTIYAPSIRLLTSEYQYRTAHPVHAPLIYRYPKHPNFILAAPPPMLMKKRQDSSRLVQIFLATQPSKKNPKPKKEKRKRNRSSIAESAPPWTRTRRGSVVCVCVCVYDGHHTKISFIHRNNDAIFIVVESSTVSIPIQELLCILPQSIYLSHIISTAPAAAVRRYRY